MSSKKQHPVHPMTIDAASDYARRIVDEESRGPGGLERALTLLERHYGLTRWQLNHLRSGRAKSCEMGLYERLRSAYLDICQKQVSRLQHEIAVEKAKNNDNLADIEAEAEALAEKIEAQKAAIRARR
jgi:hypothetical protein